MAGTTAILSAVSSASQFMTQQSNASSLDRQATFDQNIATGMASDAIARGNYDASRRLSAGRQMVGAQRAAAGASGIDPNTGSAAALQTDEAKYSALDALTIKNNAAREAWGYTAQSQLNQQGLRNQADQMRIGSYNTLLTAGSDLARYGLSRRSTTTPTTTTPSRNQNENITNQWWRGGGY